MHLLWPAPTARTAILLLRVFSILLAVLTYPSSAVAQKPVVTKMGWEISRNDGYCMASNTYESGLQIYFTLDWKSDEIALYLFNERWKSLQDRNGETLHLDINLSGNVEYDNWYSKDANIIGDKDKGVTGLMAHWDKEHHDDFLVSWSLATGFSATAEGNKLGSFTLSGSRDAMLALVKCAANGLKNDRSDPFAG